MWLKKITRARKFWQREDTSRPQPTSLQSPLLQLRNATCVVALSKNRLACGTKNGHLQLLSSSCGNTVLLDCSIGHSKPVTRICCSCAPIQKLFTGSRDCSIGVWTPEGKLAGKWSHTHNFIITGLATNSDGSRLVSGSRDSCVYLWDVDRGERVAKRQISRNLVTHIVWGQSTCSPHSSGLIAQSSEDKSIHLYDPRDLKHIWETERAAHIQNYCDLSSDMKYLIGSSRGTPGLLCGGSAKVWDIRMLREVGKLTDSMSPLSVCRWLPSDFHCGGDFSVSGTSAIITASTDGEISLWQASTTSSYQLSTALTLYGAGEVNDLAFLDMSCFVVTTLNWGLVVVRLERLTNGSFRLALVEDVENWSN